MVDREIYNKLPKFKNLKDLYVVGYTIEVGSDEANKYIKRIDDVEKGIKEIYKDGKDMWEQNVCSKFRITIFKKYTDELVISFRPDMINFESKSGKDYIPNLNEEIKQTYKLIAEKEHGYSWYKNNEMYIKRQINEKCVLNKKTPLLERDYIEQEKQRIFFDILKNIERFGQPEYINSIFGNALIGNSTIIGRKEDIKSYIEVQITTADDTFNIDLFEEDNAEKEKYIDNWNKTLKELRNTKEDNVLVLKKQENIFRTMDMINQLKELQDLLDRIETEQTKENTEEEESQI